MNRDAAISIGGVLVLAAAAAVTLILTDEPDVIQPDFAFEVSSSEEIPSAVRAVNRSTGEDMRCVVAAESQDGKIVVSGYCPRPLYGDWEFQSLD